MPAVGSFDAVQLDATATIREQTTMSSMTASARGPETGSGGG